MIGKVYLLVGGILLVAATCGLMFTLVAVGPNGPHGGVTPLILLPYAVVIIGLAGVLLIRIWFKGKD